VALTLATLVVMRVAVVTACTAGTGLARSERLLVWIGGLKGAVPLLLATLPALELLEDSDRVQAIVLVATAASIVLQGAGLKLMAARAHAQAAASSG
jgi:potassium/hydrogen antiporter